MSFYAKLSMKESDKIHMQPVFVKIIVHIPNFMPFLKNES